MGIRVALENQPVPGLMKINAFYNYLDLMAVAILPEIKLSETERFLITAIIN